LRAMDGERWMAIDAKRVEVIWQPGDAYSAQWIRQSNYSFGVLPPDLVLVGA